MTTASDWLKSPNRNYADGIQLLKQLDPKDRHLKFLDVSKPDEYKATLLRDRIAYHNRLGKQARVESKAEVTGANKTVQIVKPKPQTPLPQTPQQRVVIDDNPSVRYEDLPSEYQRKYDAVKSAGRKLASLKEALKVAQNDAERADIGKQLDTIEDEKNKLWGEIDAYWNANKKTPAPDPKPNSKGENKSNSKGGNKSNGKGGTKGKGKSKPNKKGK